MRDRKAKVYWFKRSKDDKDTLIFDPGYHGGDIHVYEHNETMKATRLEEQLKKFGYHMDWKIIRPNDPVTKDELNDALSRVTHHLHEFQDLLVRGLKNN